MPGMPRPDNAGKKIAYDILGNPSNVSYKKSRKKNKVQERLDFEDTRLVR